LIHDDGSGDGNRRGITLIPC